MSAGSKRHSSALGTLVASSWKGLHAAIVGFFAVFGVTSLTGLALLPIILLIGIVANLWQVGVIGYQAVTNTLPPVDTAFLIVLALKVFGVFIGWVGAFMGWLGMFF